MDWTETERKPIANSTVVRRCQGSGFYATMRWTIWETNGTDYRMKEEEGQPIYSSDPEYSDLWSAMEAVCVLMRRIEAAAFANDIKHNKCLKE